MAKKQEMSLELVKILSDAYTGVRPADCAAEGTIRWWKSMLDEGGISVTFPVVHWPWIK